MRWLVEQDLVELVKSLPKDRPQILSSLFASSWCADDWCVLHLEAASQVEEVALQSFLPLFVVLTTC